MVMKCWRLTSISVYIYLVHHKTKCNQNFTCKIVKRHQFSKTLKTISLFKKTAFKVQASAWDRIWTSCIDRKYTSIYIKIEAISYFSLRFLHSSRFYFCFSLFITIMNPLPVFLSLLPFTHLSFFLLFL